LCLSVEIKKLIWERDQLKRKAVYTNDENVFNKHFTEIGPKLAVQIPKTGAASYNIPQCNEVFELHEVTPSQIDGLIYKLSTSKASAVAVLITFLFVY
jgi:hypothetical protein